MRRDDRSLAGFIDPDIMVFYTCRLAQITLRIAIRDARMGNDNAIAWLRTTGGDWWEMLGLDRGILNNFLDSHNALVLRTKGPRRGHRSVSIYQEALI